MTRFILICLVCFALITPSPANAFGFMKYIWDGINNQLGLDRGEIPKVKQRCRFADNKQYEKRIPRHTYRPVFHLQAEGF
jgi:hypothetical protein